MTEDPIAAINDLHAEATRTEDVASLVKDVEDGVIWMPPAETNLYGKPEVEEWWREYFEFFTIAQLETTERTIEIVGDIAVERTSWSLKLIPKKGGSAIYDDGRFLTIWRRQADGGWKIWQRIWNSVKPIGAGTNRFLVKFIQRRDE